MVLIIALLCQWSQPLCTISLDILPDNLTIWIPVAQQGFPSHDMVSFRGGV